MAGGARAKSQQQLHRERTKQTGPGTFGSSRPNSIQSTSRQLARSHGGFYLAIADSDECDLPYYSISIRLVFPLIPRTVYGIYGMSIFVSFILYILPYIILSYATVIYQTILIYNI